MAEQVSQNQHRNSAGITSRPSADAHTQLEAPCAGSSPASPAKSLEHRQALSAALKGRPKTDEQKAAISAAMKASHAARKAAKEADMARTQRSDPDRDPVAEIERLVQQGPQGPQPAPQPTAPAQYGTDMSAGVRQADAAVAKADAALIQEVFFSHFPAFRPSYSDCQVLMACTYQMSLHGQLSMGQRTLCAQIIKRLKAKGIIQ